MCLGFKISIYLMLILLCLTVIDSSNFSFSRPVSIRIFEGRIYILEITGNLWVMNSLKSEPVLLVKGLNQPSYDIEIIDNVIFIAHEGSISKFYKNLEHILTNLPKYTINSTIKLSKDSLNSIYIAVAEKLYRFRKNNLTIVASGFYEPIKLRNYQGKFFLLAKINEENSGIFPIYENLNYSEFEPIIKFGINEQATSFHIYKDKIIVSFRDGRIVEYSKFRELFKSDILFKSYYEIVDFEVYKDSFYVLDFANGKIYRLK